MRSSDPAIDPAVAARARDVRRRAELLSRLLDSAVAIPGTRFRIGLDALIGLIPGIGDALGVIIGAWFLLEGARAGAPPALLARMLGNLLVDLLAGFVPVVGDIADAWFKANRRNARLLGEHLDRLEGRPPARSWTGYLLGAALLVGAALAMYGGWTLIASLL
ncbi:MAG: DUF4112 domain-containing protein [Gammaproteobacteria bacterium]